MTVSFLRRIVLAGLAITGGALVAQPAPKADAAVFFVETSPAFYSGSAKPELGFVIQGESGTFVPKFVPPRVTANPSLHVNALGLGSGKGINTTAPDTYRTNFGDIALYKIDPPAGLSPLTIAALQPQGGETVKVWLWDKQRRQAVELAAKKIPSELNQPERVRLSRRVEQKDVVGAPLCNANGEVFGLGCKQTMVSDADLLLFIPLKHEWADPKAGGAPGVTREIPTVWRTWLFDGKNKQPAVATSISGPGDAILLGLWHDDKWLQRPMPLARLSEADRDWVKAMTAPADSQRSPLPISRAANTLVIASPEPGQFPWPLSKPPKRPCLEIDGLAGTVTFRARTKSNDRVFSMTDPAFQAAVKARTLDQLIGQTYVKYTPLGTLTLPAKFTDFPLLGQDNTGTCYVSHYREWLVYYLGDRALLLPCLEDLRGYLNFLLNDHPSLSEVFAGRDAKNTAAFNANTRLARARSHDFLNNVGFFCRNFLIGADTMPYTKFADIDTAFQHLKFSTRTRQFSEDMFGTMLEGLLLGQMTLGESESHVMNIIGIDGDRLLISTWAREYEGTLRELARLDKRGPLLAPTVFAQFPIVARNQEGRVAIPTIDPAITPGLIAPQLKAVARFNTGSGSR